MDPQTRRAIQSLTRELQRTQAELARIKRGSRRPQLGYSSIDSGALEVRDPDTGVTRLRLGYQPDGSVGVVPEGGDPPPAPSTPIVAGAPVGVMVQWDGRLAHDQTLPADFDHVSVHVSQVQGFVPDAATFQGTIPRAGGLFPVVPLEVGTTYYVRLVGVGTGGAEGAPSEEASGVPEAVGGVPPPGSITETEIADDAVTTPKIRAEAVEAYHIVAQAIEAGHIQAQAIEASHLAATIVLASRLVAGNPGAARVEIDENGLRGYSGEDELTFALTDDGDAIFSGRIQGAEIAGSRMHIGSSPDAHGTVEAAQNQARIVMDSATGTRSQLVAHEDFAEFGVYSRGSDVENSPGGVFWALQDQVYSTLQARFNDFSRPYMLSTASPTQVSTNYYSGNGNNIWINAANQATIGLSPEESPEGNPSAQRGVLYAFRSATDDVPLVTLQSPTVHEGPGQGRRSSLHVRGTNGVGHATADMRYHGNRHLVANDTWDGHLQTEDGRLELASTHSILSSRHRYVRASWLGEQPTGTTTASFVPFTEEEYERPVVRTGASGAVRVTISAYGRNQVTDSSLLIIGFALGPYGASRARSAEIRVSSTSTPSLQQCAVYYLDLEPDTSYFLVPYWYLSSGEWGANAVLSSTGENSIVAEALT